MIGLVQNEVVELVGQSNSVRPPVSARSSKRPERRREGRRRSRKGGGGSCGSSPGQHQDHYFLSISTKNQGQGAVKLIDKARELLCIFPLLYRHPARKRKVVKILKIQGTVLQQARPQVTVNMLKVAPAMSTATLILVALNHKVTVSMFGIECRSSEEYRQSPFLGHSNGW